MGGGGASGDGDAGTGADPGQVYLQLPDERVRQLGELRRYGVLLPVLLLLLLLLLLIVAHRKGQSEAGRETQRTDRRTCTRKARRTASALLGCAFRLLSSPLVFFVVVYVLL